MTDSSRLAALEQQAVTLAAEIAALKAERPAPPPPPPRDEVRIVPLLHERTDGMPTLKEMERLFTIVKSHSPWPQALNDRFDEHRPFRAFSSAFRWLQNVGRTERPNGRVALSFWADTCRLWLRARNSVGSDLDGNALILAVFASGDIVYTPADPARGWTWEFGLVEYGGRPASADGWRRVLSTGNVLSPSSPARRDAPLSPVRIYGG
jgi:hypothetical protein